MSAFTATAPDRVLDLGDLLRELVAHGRVDQDVAEQCLAIRRSSLNNNQHPLEFLAAQQVDDLTRPGKKLDLETLTVWLANFSGQPYLRIDPLKIDVPAITPLMSYAFAQRHKILAVAVDSESVTIASSQPLVHSWEANLVHVLKRPIKRVVANPADIQRFTTEFYRLARSVSGANATDQKVSGVGNFEQLLSLGAQDQEPDANDAHIVTIVDWLWQYAFEQRASDIHIEPRRDFGVVRFRIDGVLHQVYQIPMPVLGAMTSRIKILGRMDVVEKRRPQDGRIKTRAPDGQEIELRLSTLPTAFGEKLVMRVFDPEVLVRDFRDLGFSDEDARRWKQMTTQPNGIVLVTGPTGSGKTTTLYSTLKNLATPEVNVCTLEDPIEMIEPAFNQTQVQPQLDFGFTEGLRALMRQDPDIIMVGEIRDTATAEMAVQAALTGHLVFSTLHTNDAPSAVSRLMELGVPPYLLNATLLGVLAQRLVRVLCPLCKEPDTQTTREMVAEMMSPWKLTGGFQPYQPVGCEACRMTGFKGRMGLYELLLSSEALHQHMNHSPSMDVLRRQAVQDGMRPLRLSGALRVAEGVTTLAEVMAATPPLR